MTLKRPLNAIAAIVAVTLLASGRPVQSGARPVGPGGTPESGAEGGGGPGRDVIGPIRRALHELDLDADQQQRIRTTFERHRDGELREVGRAFVEARQALELRIWNLDVSEAEILEASNLLAERARAFDRARRSLALDVLPILTEEQQNAFREELAEMPGPGGPPRRRMR